MGDERAHLLVVDDNEINCRLMSELFGGEGYKVSTATDGKAALALLASEPFDLMLLDVMMPVMDGLATLRHLRENPETAALPVVLVSAMSDTRDIVRGLQLGANDYLTKPIRRQVALARVETQLTLRSLLAEREETIAQLEESRKMRERFFQMASHDLKQPLSTLKVANVLLADLLSEESNPRARGVLDTIENTLNNMTSIVTDFLDSAMVEGGSLEIKIREVDVRDLVWASVTQQMPAAHKKDVKVAMTLREQTVTCDPVRFSQVMNNLVNNAIKYSPPGGEVRVWMEDKGDDLRVLVQDQGVGVPPGERDRLFQPFSKLSARPTAGESSHGLGLWIAKQLIELQHGDIGLETPEAGGSVFWVSIPKADGER